MDFDIPSDVAAFITEVDQFIEDRITPLEQADDNVRFFDHRREDARTDWDRDGLPNEDWEALLHEAKNLAIEASIYSYPFPAEYGGRDGSNLGMAIIREHLAAKGLGLHNDLQNEHSVVGNNLGLLLMLEYGSEAQQRRMAGGAANSAQGLCRLVSLSRRTAPMPPTWKPTRYATAMSGSSTGEKTWNTGVHIAHS